MCSLATLCLENLFSMDLERNFVPHHNVVAMLNLDIPEAVDFREIILFLRRSRIFYAISANPKDAPLHDPMIPDSPREGQVVDTSDSESTKSDDNDPDAERICFDRRPQPISFLSRRIKMVVRRKRKKTSGPPPESSSRGKRIENDDADYNPAKDLDPEVTRAKWHKVSRPKFVTKPSRVLVQEGINILNTIFSQVTTTTQVQVTVSSPPCPTSSSTQVTPDTQRLLDELIRTPPVGS
ncbi:hypothetical protein L1987_32450 [Smallanthus sonchifolius]|uniref:Uncharacterized protein n=1 Tax=Smallanthus sonchifolius TaxID=185202 RepID=A0ACB9HNX6_9ASTR|nr:hypothetical protein L1987_32450 [Smallanthus sonchifolius]